LPPARPALFVSYSGVLGGAERILLDVAEGLDRPALLACPEGALADAAREQGLEVASVRRRSLSRRAAPLGIAGLAREAAGIARRADPAVILAWSMRALLACAPLPRTAPLVFQHNDLLPTGLAAPAVRRAARRASRVVCLSRAIADDLRVPAQVVHPGVELERLRPAPVAPDRPVALTLGAIVDWKHPELALEIAARVPDLRLRLAGEPLDAGRRLLERLRRRAAEPDLAGRVELLGRVSDPLEALQGASCLLHCAGREPFGLALVEALACGVPVVAPAAAGPVEIVDDSCGRLYSPGDAAAGAAAVREVLAEPALRDGARARAESHFGREHMRTAYRDLVEGLV
jgi:glycosyltransferase involved in cell wall biosynthesis